MAVAQCFWWHPSSLPLPLPLYDLAMSDAPFHVPSLRIVIFLVVPLSCLPLPLRSVGSCSFIVFLVASILPPSAQDFCTWTADPIVLSHMKEPWLNNARIQKQPPISIAPFSSWRFSSLPPTELELVPHESKIRPQELLWRKYNDP